jgi:hypothetical protein
MAGGGIGERLYDRVVSALAPFDPILLRAMTREDKTRSVRSSPPENFSGEMRDWESRLDMGIVRFGGVQRCRISVTSQGLTILTLAEVQSLYSDWKEKLSIWMDRDTRYARPRHADQPSFQHWERTRCKARTSAEAWFIASMATPLSASRHCGKRAGPLISGRRDRCPAQVSPRGIALALRCVPARSRKTTAVHRSGPGNAQTNRAMLSINESLGFIKQPAWIAYAKTLKTEDTEGITE